MRKKLFTLAVLMILGSSASYAADMSDWEKYADSLQNCTAGTFTLLDPVQVAVAQPPSTVKYEITGWNNAGKCQVSITRVIKWPGDPTPKDVIINCIFDKENLGVLTQQAKDIASGNVTLSTDDPSAAIMTKSCK